MTTEHSAPRRRYSNPLEATCKVCGSGVQAIGEDDRCRDRRSCLARKNLRDNRGFPDEESFQSWIIQIAKLNGWRYYHTRRSDRSVKGFPDLVLIRPNYGDLVYAELKHGKNLASPEQRGWLADLVAAGAEVYLWYPRDMDDIQKRLERRGDEKIPE